MSKSITRSLAAPVLTLCALAACSEQQPEPEIEPVSTEDVQSEGELSEEGIPATPAITAGTIPVRYQGVWDYQDGSCAPESDMRMAVTAYDITYYESYGRVTGTRPEGGDLIVDLAMEGEGDQWAESQRLSLVGTGTAARLHVTNGEQPKVDDQYPRKFCP